MPLDELTSAAVDDLVVRALVINDEEDDDYWELVRELQRRGDQANFEAIRVLSSLSSEPERRLGVNVLGQLGHLVGRPHLEESLPIVLGLTGPDESVGILVAAVVALGHLHDPRGLSGVIRHLAHPDDGVRLAVAQALPSVADDPVQPQVLRGLLTLMEDPDPDVRDWATFGLGAQLEIDTAEVRDALFARIYDPGGNTAGEALSGLGSRKDPRVFEPIAEELKRDNVGNLVVEAAAELADPRLLPDLYRLRDIGWEDRDLRPEWLAVAIEACGGQNRN